MNSKKGYFLLALLFSFVLSLKLSAQYFHEVKRAIIFSFKPTPYKSIFIIKEKRSIQFSPGNGSIITRSDVTRIRFDSIYLDNIGYRVRDLNTIIFKTFYDLPRGPFKNRTVDNTQKGMYFFRKDSTSWDIFYPPEDAYEDAFSFNRYLHKVDQITHSEKMEKYRNPLLFRNFIKVNLAKLAHVEIAFAYERQIAKNVSLETEIGYQVGFPGADASYYINYPFFNYTGWTFLANPKFYVFNSRTYISPVLLYKYLYFTGVRTGYLSSGSEGGSLQNQFRDEYGASIRVGIMKRVGWFVYEVYGGLGLKILTIRQFIYANYLYHDSGEMHWRHADHSPDIFDNTVFFPIVNLGIKIGVGF